MADIPTDAQLNVLRVKLLERRRHVVIMNEQLFVGRRHGLSVHLLQRRQDQPQLRVELVQRMGEQARHLARTSTGSGD